jgi:uncharacterized membrane protein
MNDDLPTPAFERAVSRLMLAGVWTASACLAAGLVLWLRTAGLSGEGALHAGLLVLMATPALRVVLSVAESIRQRDWFAFASTLAVLAILIAGTMLALRHP